MDVYNYKNKKIFIFNTQKYTFFYEFMKNYKNFNVIVSLYVHN